MILPSYSSEYPNEPDDPINTGEIIAIQQNTDSNRPNLSCLILENLTGHGDLEPVVIAFHVIINLVQK